MEYTEKINLHYKELIKKYGYSKSGIGWKSDKVNLRFSKFTNHMKFENSNILDFGAGLAHFYEYLKKKKIKFSQYSYYDINNSFKDFLKKKKFFERNYIC